jgi:hypothetical protein
MGGGGRRGRPASPVSAADQALARDLGPARELLQSVRSVPPSEVPRATAELLASGAETASLWDALVIAAAEISVEDPSIAPLHAVTSVNALHHIALHAPSEHVAQLALCQAAAWTRAFHERGPTRLRLDELEPSEAHVSDVLGPPDSTSLDVRGARCGSARTRLGVRRARVANRAHARRRRAPAQARGSCARRAPARRKLGTSSRHRRVCSAFARRTDSERLAEIRGALDLAQK